MPDQQNPNPPPAPAQSGPLATQPPQGPTDLMAYGTYTADAAKRERKNLDAEGSEFIKLPVGTTVLRVLPPFPGQDTPFFETHEHNVDIPGAKSKLRFKCPRLMADRPCPACDKVDALSRTGNPADREFAYQLRAQRKVYANVVIVKALERGVLTWTFGKRMHDYLVGLRDDEDKGGDFSHPVTGFNLIIERAGTGKTDTKYKIYPARNQTPLPDMGLLAKRRDLRQYAVLPTADEILAMLQELVAGTTGGGGQRRGGRAQDNLEPGSFQDDDPFGG